MSGRFATSRFGRAAVPGDRRDLHGEPKDARRRGPEAEGVARLQEASWQEGGLRRGGRDPRGGLRPAPAHAGRAPVPALVAALFSFPKPPTSLPETPTSFPEAFQSLPKASSKLPESFPKPRQSVPWAPLARLGQSWLHLGMSQV